MTSSRSLEPIAVALCGRGRAAEACRLFAAAARQGALTYPGMYVYALALAKSGRREQAQRLYDAAQAVAPQAPGLPALQGLAKEVAALLAAAGERREPRQKACFRGAAGMVGWT